MNMNNLHELINRYEANYEMVNGTEHDEKFKWGAVQQFQNIWFSDAAKGMPFSERFKQAVSKCSVLLNTSIMHPTNGIVKMAEKYPAEMEALFCDLLFAPYESIDELQVHIDRFLDETEKIRLELFPKYYSYKQDRHAASCYLAFYAPQTHYIYRFSEAEEFAQYVEFGKSLGSGSYFSLKHYYELADIVVDALKEHKTLLDKYDKLLKGRTYYYYDPSLHIMAFDLIYCCRCYNFYHGLTHASNKDALKSYTIQQLKEKEAAERQQKIYELEGQIHEIDVQMEPLREISLLNVEVEQAQRGKGIVIAQNEENITVQFENAQVKYIISRKYPMRPRFEDDNEVVEAFTKLAELKENRDRLAQKLSKI